MDYTLQDDALVFVRTVGAYRFQFVAEQIRQERTGVHARLRLALNGVDLAWGYMNIDKDEERVRITNSAYGMVTQDKRSNGLLEYPKDYLRHDLNEFCAGLWDAHVAQLMPAALDGALLREQPSFALEPFILDGAGTIIFGPPGRGKSYVMLLLAICLDAGLAMPWRVPSPEKVLIINLERSARSLQQRIGNVNAALGLARDRSLRVINARGRSLEDVLPAVRRYVQTEGIDVIFLDSLSRAGQGDMNDNAAMNRVVDRLNSFSTWVALGHTPRGDTSHLFGSQMQDAAADLTVRLHSEQEDDGPLGIGLELDKRNDTGWYPMKVLALEFDAYGLVRIRPARNGEFPDVESGKKLSMRQMVMQFLLDADGGAADATTIANQTGYNRSNVATLLTHDKEHFTFVRKEGQRVLYGVLNHA